MSTSSSAPANSVRALVSSSIDYAGLFPPASLALGPALQNYAAYNRTADAWMLGPFVLPLNKFDEAGAQLANFDVEHPLRISALIPKTEPTEFASALTAAIKAVRSFRAAHDPRAIVSQVELALPAQRLSTSEVGEMAKQLRVPIFVEAAADQAEHVIAALAQQNRSAVGELPIGFKLRTGGVVASAFPSSVQIARALVAAATNAVPIKFTAGLHHPVRQFHASVQTKMHGFVNVLGAGVLAVEHGWDVQQTAAMLEDEEASAFQFSANSFSWRDWKIETDRLAMHRSLITSFGSCSFDEPRDDLRALNLL